MKIGGGNFIYCSSFDTANEQQGAVGFQEGDLDISGSAVGLTEAWRPTSSPLTLVTAAIGGSLAMQA